MNYFLDISKMLDEVKVWSQMFFDDGSVTQAKYISCSIYTDDEECKKIAHKFLTDTHRREGVLFIWGAGQVFCRNCKLTNKGLIFKRMN